jgi:hypothetical protein
LGSFCGSDDHEPIITRSEIVHDKIKVSKNAGSVGSSSIVIKFFQRLRKTYNSFHIALYKG